MLTEQNETSETGFCRMALVKTQLGCIFEFRVMGFLLLLVQGLQV